MTKTKRVYSCNDLPSPVDGIVHLESNTKYVVMVPLPEDKMRITGKGHLSKSAGFKKSMLHCNIMRILDHD